MTTTPTTPAIRSLTTSIRNLLDPLTRSTPPATTRTWPALAGWPGLYLGVGKTGPVFGGPEHHALVIGPPRSGKTTGLVIPNLNLHPGPTVATTTKTDLTTATLPWRASRGRCWWWDPTGTSTPPPGTTPLRWSPIVGCETWDAAINRAHALATASRPTPTAINSQHHGETHWVERAQALLAPLLHAAALAPTSMTILLAWLHRHELVQPLYILDRHHARVAGDLLTGIASTDPRELSGIFSTADSLLASYRTTAALDATTDPNFDPDAFASSTDTIYLASPGTSQAQHAPLIICLLDQIRTATYRTRPWPPMLWALDELANIAPLPDLPATISEGASQGLLVAACLQDLSQARTRWGGAAEGFATLFTHKLVLPGIADLVTLRQISALAGSIDTPITSHQKDGNPFGRTSTNTTPQQRPRLPLDRIANGQPGYALWLNRTTIRTVGLPTWNMEGSSR
jgi:type IV secretory pathway TraG/TraD family ATPase VirD4